ncbi:MAG: O-antigen ligase family protein [Planctomycetota bacterium]
MKQAARWPVLLLPVLGILAVDPVPGDWHAIKYVVLTAGAFVCVVLALDTRLAWSRVSLALFVFVAVRGLMLWNSPLPGRALRWWGLLLALVLAHHAACATTPRRWLRQRAPLVLGGLALVVSVYALAQRFHLPQAHTFFANRSFSGAALAMLAPFALALRRPRLAIGVVVVGLVATGSRGGALAAAAAFALWYVWTRPRLRWPVLVGLPAVVLAAGLLFGSSPTVKVRLYWYEAAFDLGLRHPVAGVGADGFQREYPPIRTRAEHRISRGGTVDAVHDDYLESFAEGGLLGLGAHIFLLVAAAGAVRRHRIAACSLLAFAVASLVDLPLRDPSLLALVFLPLAMAAPRRRVHRSGTPAVLGSLLVIAFFLPFSLQHWRAERRLMRDVPLERDDLDAVLAIEPDHPQALILRSSPEDLDRLLELEPHHAGAHFNRALDLPEAEAITALEAILRDHDPHHALTKQRLQILRSRETDRRAREIEPLLDDEPVRAASVLDRLIDKDPHATLPYLLKARLHRLHGQPEAAERRLREAEERSDSDEVRLERLAFELAEIREGRWDPARLAYALERLEADVVVERIEAALARGREVEQAMPPPRVPKEPAEDAVAYAKRIDEVKGAWRRRRAERTRPFYLEALLLAEALTARQPTVEHLRLVATAARGMRDLDRARQADALALFAEALEACVTDNEPKARSRLRKALLAYPKLDREEGILAMLRLFAERYPEAVPRARRLLRDRPRLAAALGG